MTLLGDFLGDCLGDFLGDLICLPTLPDFFTHLQEDGLQILSEGHILFSHLLIIILVYNNFFNNPEDDEFPQFLRF